MKALNEEEKEVATHLKASIWYTVSRTVEQQTKKLSEESGSTITATPQMIAALVELVYRQLTDVGEDLALFANHAGRKTVNPNDMFMIVRKNEGLKKMLNEYLDKLGSNDGKSDEEEEDDDNAKVKQEKKTQNDLKDDEDTFSDMGDYI